MHRPAKGFVLLMSLFVITGLASLVSVSLTRSAIEMRAASQFITSQQAFYLAEAGLDKKTYELNDSSPTNDLTPIQTASSGGTYSVTVTQLDPATLRLDSLGQIGTTTRGLSLTVQKKSTLPVLGAVTVVDEGATGMEPSFIKSGRLNLTNVNGCDLGDPSQCFPGLALTSQHAYDDFAAYIPPTEAKSGYFGDRLTGAKSDYAGGLLPTHYSARKMLNSGLDYTEMRSLADFAKAEAIKNGCYIDVTNDDSPATDQVVIDNRTLGTPAAPKVCYAEAPFKKNADGTYAGVKSQVKVSIAGMVKGAGVLVVNGELDESETPGLTFQYDGLVIAVGPTAGIELDGVAQVHGAMFMATTDPTYAKVGGAPSWMKPDFKPRGIGTVQYSSTAIDMSLSLLGGWTPSGNNGNSSTGVTTLSWSER